jgi:hypothetical protein
MNILGYVTSYDDLHQILRRRAEELDISREVIDEYAGLQPGYSGKLLAPRASKHLGKTTFPLLLPALAVRLVAISDEDALARLKSSSKVQRRQSKHAIHAKVVEYRLSRRLSPKNRQERGRGKQEIHDLKFMRRPFTTASSTGERRPRSAICSLPGARLCPIREGTKAAAGQAARRWRPSASPGR